MLYSEFPHIAAISQHPYDAFLTLSPGIALITM